MTAPANHRVSILNRFGNTITAPVVYVKDLGSGKAEVRVETTYHIEDSYDLPATYTVPGKEARGHYRVSAKVFTAAQTYIYIGVFTRK
jgi:hypothetical protein